MRDSRLETGFDAGLRFGVRLENQGHVVHDYHTITNCLTSADGIDSTTGLRRNQLSILRFYVSFTLLVFPTHVGVNHRNAKLRLLLVGAFQTDDAI